jgi:N-ethylmaleimide reductase
MASRFTPPTAASSISSSRVAPTSARTSKEGRWRNRTRLLFEIVEALTPIWGRDRIGVLILPLGKMNGIHDAHPEATFGYVAERLSDYDLAYLHMVNPALEQMQNGEGVNRKRGAMVAGKSRRHDRLRPQVHRQRLRVGAPLNIDDPTTYYGGGETGYTDHPSLAQDRGEDPKACVDQSWSVK